MSAPMTWDPPEILGPRNRRVMAERRGWPPGRLDACLALELRFPGWDVAWFNENRRVTPGLDCDEGFYAWRHGDQPGWTSLTHGFQPRHEVHATSPAEMAGKLSYC